MARQYSDVVITDDNVDAEAEKMIDNLPVETVDYNYDFVPKLPKDFDKVTNKGSFDYYCKSYYHSCQISSDPCDIGDWYLHGVGVEFGNGFIFVKFEYDDGGELRDKG